MDTIDLTKPNTDQVLQAPSDGSPAPKPITPQVAEASAKRVSASLDSPQQVTPPKAAPKAAPQSAPKPAPKITALKKPAVEPAATPTVAPTAGPTASPVSLPVAGEVSSESEEASLLGSTGIVPSGIRVVSEEGGGKVALTGRVISTWGEAVDGIHLVVTDEAGKVHAEGYTNAEGRYKLAGVPVGDLTVAMAPNAPLGKRGPRGIIVRVRPKPIVVRSFPGQERVIVEDQVVNVAPIFRVDGKIEVSTESFETFKRDLVAKDAGMAVLKDERLMRIYLRGLELVQKNLGGKGKARHVEITPDGSFSWECSLPAEDVLFVLSPRSSLPSPAYQGPVGVEVTPAGVRTAKLKIQYPPLPKSPAPKEKKPADEKPKDKEPKDKNRKAEVDTAEAPPVSPDPR